MWYAAHVIEVLRRREGVQTSFPLYENVFLVEAASADEAFEIARKIGEDEAAHDDPTLTWNGGPSRWTFAGVRKVVECLSPIGPDLPDLGTGTEITYTEFSVDSEEALAEFLRGQGTVTLQDRFPDDE